MKINEFKLVQACFACPEQYDVFKDGKQVGYLRLRHGTFTVEVPNCGGELIFEAHPEGDGLFTDEERNFYINEALGYIRNYLKNEK